MFICILWLLQDWGGVAARLLNLGSVQWAVTSSVLPSLTGNGKHFCREVNFSTMYFFSFYNFTILQNKFVVLQEYIIV